MKKILSIGDIHGRDSWMWDTHGSSCEFNSWKISVENGAPGDDPFWDDIPFREYDKIIFIGDYVDSFDLGDDTILRNLQNIIFFKKAAPDRVVLLLGNHDIQYFIKNQICSGYRTAMHPILTHIFADKECGFKLAHFEVGENGDKWLWTHAGISEGWLKEFRSKIFNPNHRLYEIYKDYSEDQIDELLNVAFEAREDVIFSVDVDSGGWDTWAGPLWIRPGTLNAYPLLGINQVVGHTVMKKIRIEKFEAGFANHFIDCPFEDTLEDPLIIQI
jgi:predicted MPP superfamily phosphohydrolase